MKRSFPAWIALAAIFLQAVWPLLSHARPAEAPLLVPLCTVSGETHDLELKTGKQTPLDERSANHGEHCKLCVFEGPKDVLVGAFAGFDFVLQVLDGAIPDSRSEQPGSRHSLAAHPRAPPPPA